MKNKMKIIIPSIFMVLVILLGCGTAYADDWYEDEGYYTIYVENSKEVLFMIARKVEKGDEYVSKDNKLYEVTKVSEKNHTGYAKYKEDIKLPEISSIEEESLLSLAQGEERKVGIYHTHSDESYEPSDGTYSINGKGGIYKVGDALTKGLENNGIQVDHNQNLHLPHDAGAYRRSRPTAQDTLKRGPSAVFDVHRDAIPPEQYAYQVNDKDATKVRLVLGKRNQNIEKNKNLAFKLKAVADEMYPGMIKDIFMGKGNYNQDMAPNTILLEMGAHKNTREAAENTANAFADVIKVAVFGGEEKTAPTAEQPSKVVKNDKPAATDNKGSGKGMFIVLAIAAVLGIGFLFISSSGNEMRSKFGQTFSSFMGRRKK